MVIGKQIGLYLTTDLVGCSESEPRSFKVVLQEKAPVMISVFGKSYNLAAFCRNEDLIIKFLKKRFGHGKISANIDGEFETLLVGGNETASCRTTKLIIAEKLPLFSSFSLWLVFFLKFSGLGLSPEIPRGLA